jgi:anti-sigma28 factor (negative regulator of flagellin synthesis)
VDKLELSGVSHLLTSLKTNDVRTDKVSTVRAQIEAGTYEDDQKLETAIDRLLDDLER